MNEANENTDLERSALLEPLPELLDHDEPAEFAERNGITYRDGAVEVAIELEPNSDLPTEYVASIEYRRNDVVFAFVSVSMLRDLADDERVRVVRLPDRSEPMGE